MSNGYKVICLIICLILLVSGLYGEYQERIIVQSHFKPIKKIYPEYPKILKKKGVAARMALLISIDRKGNVINAGVFLPHPSFYPELDDKIEDVFSQWKFEPFIYDGDPISIWGFLTVIFFPGKLSPDVRKSELMMEIPEKKLDVHTNKELQMVLDKCTEYCFKLSEAALFYVCYERIRERSKRIEEIIGRGLSGNQDLRYDQLVAVSLKYLTLGKADRHNYVYDYQLIKKEGNIQEKRILIEKDGKNINLEGVPWETKPSYSLKPLLVPVQLLGHKNRSLYLFKLAKDERIKGKLAYVIEASLRPGQTGNIKWGRIWIDKSDFRIVKAEVETDFAKGYEDILYECDNYFLKPHFKSTHYYEVEKNDILFPGRSEIRIDYSGFLMFKQKLKSEIKITYGNYKFFTVETDHNIIKKKLEAMFKTRDKLIFENSMKFLPLIIWHF